MTSRRSRPRPIKRFDGVDAGLDRIEKLILVDHKRRIERLELEMKDLKDLLAVK